MQQTAGPAAQPGSPSALPNSQGQIGAARTLNLSREIFGFASAGRLADPNVGYQSWNFDLLSTVAFFALHIRYDGKLVGDSTFNNVWNTSVLTGLVNTAHAHGVKVVVTIVGPHTVIDQCDSLYNAGTTVAQIVNQVTLKGIDGVNIDYEGQLAQCNPTSPGLTPQSNQALLTNLAKLMRAGLDSAKPGYYLSIDTYSGSGAGNDGYFNIPDLNQYVDSFFIMTYDMDYANAGYPPLSCSGRLGLKCLSPVSPLTTYFYNDTTTVNQYSAVVPPSKIILGQPYYGRVACVASAVAHASPTSALTAATYLGAVAVRASLDVKPGTFKAHRDANNPSGLDRWDTWYDNSLKCWREMYWSDTTTLGARYNLVNQNKLRGVGFWTLDYGGGSPELWNALNTYFVRCATATVSPSSTTQTAGSTIAFTTTSTGCLNPQYEFWVQYPGGSWHLKQGWGGGAFSWDSSGLAPGMYTVHAWVNRSGTAWEAIGSATVTLTGCTTASLSPAGSTLPLGSVIDFTAAGSGCASPVYEFWVRYPNGTWYLKRGWGAATFSWDTTTLGPGVYTVHAWANQQGAATTLEVYGSSTFTLTACGSPTLSPAHPTQAPRSRQPPRAGRPQLGSTCFPVAESSAVETAGQAVIGACQRPSGWRNWNAPRSEFASRSRALRSGRPKSSAMNLSTDVKS